MRRVTFELEHDQFRDSVRKFMQAEREYPSDQDNKESQFFTPITF